MSEFKDLIPVLSFICMLVFGLFAIGYQKWTKKNDAVAKQKALDEGIAILRQHSDDMMKAHCEKSEGLFKNLADTLIEINDRIARLESRQSVTEAKTDLFWGTVEKNFGRLLKDFPTNKEKDILITKMIEKRLTIDEANLLKEILLAEMEEKRLSDANVVITYTWFIAALDQRIFDLEKGKVPHGKLDASK